MITNLQIAFNTVHMNQLKSYTARIQTHRKRDVSTVVSSGFHTDTLTNKTQKRDFHQVSLTPLLTCCPCQPFSSKTMLTNNTTDNFERRAQNDRAMSHALHSVSVPQHRETIQIVTQINFSLLTTLLSLLRKVLGITRITI